MNSHVDLSTITDDCLERLARGESVAQCLARYPEAAEQLAPMLSAAQQLRVLSQARLTEGQRLRTKVALREEVAVQRAQRERGPNALGITFWRPRMAPLAAMVAVLLFVTVAFSAVAASQPGDFVYPVRVAVERAPALVQSNPARRAAAELAAADRRLSDITQDDGAHPVAVNALLSSDEAAIERAQALSEAERAAILARVAAHAAILARLADETSDPASAGRLYDAADEALAMAGRAKSIVITPAPTVAPTRVSTVMPQLTRPAGGVVVTKTPANTPTAIVVRPVTATRTPVAGSTRVTAPSSTLPARPALTATRPRVGEKTPVAGHGGGTPGSQRPTGTLVPPQRTPGMRSTRSAAPSTPQPRPTFTVPPLPTFTMPPRPTFTVPPLPTFTVPPRPTFTVPPIPTFVIPTRTREGGGAGLKTSTPTPRWPTPIPTEWVPTRAPATLTPASTTRPTATTGWSTFTPAPTSTPRFERPTRTPEATQTPRRQRTSTPEAAATWLPTATPSGGGGLPVTPTDSAPQATPTSASLTPTPLLPR